MTIEPTKIQGVYVCVPKVHEDERGFFMESYRQDFFSEAGITDVFVQDNHARSMVRNTVRGLHFQWHPPIAKLVRVTRGKAFLVAVDIRKNSPTLAQWVSIEASEENKKQFYVPAGCAFGYQTLTDDCEVQYKCSATYNPEGEGAIVWNDPEIGIDWPIKDPPLLSKHSKEAGSLQDWLSDSRSEFAIF
ncbi:MAG: dTDP-4-dehydrorhamnose 3,5-epimerase [Candidatus Taylorbacteria bacterium]|nr:dTDP-4-dehydrorhamnose 3,5-epimerase [Candidatus Taylorbacteria bacterium]